MDSAVSANWADVAIILVVSVSGLLSLYRGLVREALSLGIWAVAAWSALRFGAVLAPQIPLATPSLQQGAGFTAVFVGVLIAGNLGVRMLVEVVNRAGLSGTDRMLGLLFGAARGLLIVCVLVLAARMTPLTDDPWWRESALIAQIEPLAERLLTLVPGDIASNLN
ncbi:MAG: CvpA family protein [Gammaproteobacteria bacterium]